MLPTPKLYENVNFAVFSKLLKSQKRFSKFLHTHNILMKYFCISQNNKVIKTGLLQLFSKYLEK